jgi:hypothetical protein
VTSRLRLVELAADRTAATTDRPVERQPAEVQAEPAGKFAEPVRRKHEPVHALRAEGRGLREIARHLGWGLSGFVAVQVGADVVEPVAGSPVDVRRVELGLGRQSLGQRNCPVAELPEPASCVPQAQADQPKQLAPGRRPGSHLDAAPLDERPVVVVQGHADQCGCRREFLRTVMECPLHCRHDDLVGQRGGILERGMGMRHLARLRGARGGAVRSSVGVVGKRREEFQARR